MTDQVDHTGAVTPLVVVPGHKLDEVVVESNPGLGIEDAGPVIVGKVKNVSEVGCLALKLKRSQIINTLHCESNDKYLLSPWKSVETRSSST